mmetsp:Transcript_43222/g.136677  ORF Transcript_43222/g.136677 Transcript_43222/m.136677 type:complete len:208 (-) Transcript_43222:728-1351(-)
MFSRVHHLRALDKGQLALGSNVHLKGLKRVLVHQAVMLVQGSDTQNRTGFSHVKLDDIFPEEDVADQQTLHALRRGLDASLLSIRQVPRRERDLPGLLSNLQPEGSPPLPVLGKVIPRNVGEHAAAAVPWNDEAGSARIQDRWHTDLLLCSALELQQFDCAVEVVTELQGCRPHNEIIFRHGWNIPHCASRTGRIVPSKLDLGSIVR